MSGGLCPWVLLLMLGCGFVCPAHAGSRALFVSEIEDPPVLSSKEEIIRLVDFAKKADIGILFVQVYRSSRARFPSKIADSGPYRDGLKKNGEDPVAFMIKLAHQEGIQVHAWLNLLSLGTNANSMFLKKYGPDILTRNQEAKNRIQDYQIDDQYFLEPGDPRVRDDLTSIVGEIVATYPDLDGLQMDYIRYPDLHPHYGFGQTNMDRFRKFSGLEKIDENSGSWKSWKRKQVTDLVKAVVAKAKGINPRLQVSTTGCMPYVRAREEAFQDWALWLDTGLVDFVTMMDYADDPDEFKKGIREIKNKVADFGKVKISVPAYKFIRFPRGFKNEFQYCETLGNTCAVFYYGSLAESQELRNYLKEKRAPQK